MSNKFNSSSLAEYSKSYARRLVGDYFANHTFISGADLLKLSPVGQVNLFTLNSLFDKWRAETDRLRSPYFDFEHPEVRQALQVFMNTVSQHIAIRREHVEPLINEATKKTLVLLFDPRHFFDEALRNQPDFMLTADAARQLTRYTQINKFVPAAIEERMKGKEVTYVNQALNWLDEILTQRARELEKPDTYLALFSEKVLLDPAVLLRKTLPDLLHTPAAAPAPNRSFFEADMEMAPVASPAPTAASVTAEAGPATQSSAGGGPLFLDDSRHIEPAAPSMQPSQASVRIDSTHHTPEVPTTEDSEEPSGPPTVGEAFYRAPIESIAKSISLNQKFMFINQLFNGNAGAYNQAIDELDRATSYEQARDLISYRYAAQYLWDMSSDEVATLIDILKRRFAV